VIPYRGGVASPGRSECGDDMAQTCLITWVGSFHARVRKLLYELSPSRIVYLVDAADDRMAQFQLENLMEITKFDRCLRPESFEITGGLNGSEPSQPPVAAEGETPCIGPRADDRVRIVGVYSKSGSKLFETLYSIVEVERGRDPIVNIIFDITAAPKDVIHIMTTLSSLLSTTKSPIKVKYKPRGIQNKPENYAAATSRFCDKKTTLVKYRTLEADDVGRPIKSINTPVMEIDLLNPEMENHAFEVCLFHHIPTSKQERRSTKELYFELLRNDKDTILRYYGDSDFIEKQRNLSGVEKQVMTRKKTLNFSGKKREKLLSNKISVHLLKFQSWDIVEVVDERSKDGYFVRKNESGEILSDVVDMLYNRLHTKGVDEHLRTNSH